VNVLGQEDLFPKEGYEFPNNGPTTHTRTYKVSEESPFHCTRPLKLVPDRAVNQLLAWNAPSAGAYEYTHAKTAYRATKAPLDGELRPTSSKLITEIVKQERDAQDLLAEGIKIAKMQDEAYWCDLEHDEGAESQKIHKQVIAKRRRGQRKLSENYHRQFAEHAQVIAEEKRQDQLEGEKMRRIAAEDARAEERHQEGLRRRARENARELSVRNDELVQRKERRIEEDLAAEKVVQRQNAEVAMRMEARQQAEKEKRDAKTAWRNHLIDVQARELANLAARRANNDSIAESEFLRRQELDRAKREEKAVEMRRQRNQEWLQTQRQRDMRMTDVKDVPDFDNRGADELNKANAYWRAKGQKDLQRVHRTQIKERQDMEEAEVRERRARPDVMYFLPDNEW
jgi:hypothetical protein